MCNYWIVKSKQILTMTLIKRTTATQWLFEELSQRIAMNDIINELFIQAQQYERECIEDAYMANRRNMEEGEAETYYLTNYNL